MGNLFPTRYSCVGPIMRTGLATDRPRTKHKRSWTDRGPLYGPQAVSGGPKVGRFKPVRPKLARPGTSLSNSFLGFPDVRLHGLKSTPKDRDTALALLYSLSRMIRGILADRDGIEIYTSAIVVCRLCATLPDRSTTTIAGLLLKRSLFWASMIMTKSRFPQGIFPQ